MQYGSLIYRSFGSPLDVLELHEETFQKLKPKHALVKMIAAPINPSDLIPIQGAYSHRIMLPQVAGYEGVGIVIEVSSKQYSHLLGKRVLPLRGEGTWQEYLQSPESLLIPIPESIDDFTAAQLYINPITALVVCTEKLQLKNGQTLIMNACGSSIASIIIQLSKILGFKVIALTSNLKKEQELLQLGAVKVFDYANKNLQHDVMKYTSGVGVDAGIDFIGGEKGNTLASNIQRGGVYLSLGLLSGTPVDWSYIKQSKEVMPQLFHLRHWNQDIDVNKWHSTFSRLINLIETNKLTIAKPEIIYDFQEIQQALSYLNTQTKRNGKVVLKMKK
ncbi:zinc-dependent alcohol dehydrogenase family protein [Staphylococcus epidermidis]|nr:zinc-dependent alcohol dehydrogenase family protein [Staphylococcus epidermidis]